MADEKPPHLDDLYQELYKRELAKHEEKERIRREGFLEGLALAFSRLFRPPTRPVRRRPIDPDDLAILPGYRRSASRAELPPEAPKWRPWLLWSLASICGGGALAVALGAGDLRLIPILTALAVLFALPEIVEHRIHRRWWQGITLLACIAIVSGQTWHMQGKQGANARPTITQDQRAERLQLRIEIAELIQRGRTLETNMVSIGKRQIPNPRPVVAALVRDSMQWHIEVIRFTETNFGQVEAMRVMSPPVVIDYPRGLDGVQSFRDGKRGGFDLRSSWTQVVGDLAALERFLAERPEL